MVPLWTLTRTQHVLYHKRKRPCGAGRKAVGESVSFWTFQWIVDIHRSLTCKISSRMLYAMARFIREEVKKFNESTGNIEPLPAITSTWITRFKCEWHLGKRLITIEIKVSFTKLCNRIGVQFRCNVRKRTFWELLYPGVPYLSCSAYNTFVF